MRVAIIGNSGSGSSTLAAQIIAAHPAASLVESSDVQRIAETLDQSPILLFVDPDDEPSPTTHHELFENYRGRKLRLAHRETPFLDHLGSRFEACAIPAKEWTHAAHLVVGLWHVHRYGAHDALLRLRHGIRRLNESHGGVNTSTNGYHETITAVYVQLLAQYLESAPTDMPLDMRAIALLASPLAAKDVLFAFYSRERLMSTAARAAWIDPDVTPLNLAQALRRAAPAL